MAYFSLTGVLSSIQISVFTLFNGKSVGHDQYGNRYYEAPARKGLNRTRRWVIYANKAEASLVPPLWHGWLHHQSNELPESGKDTKTQKWQQDHQANLTGTDGAYLPSGHSKKTTPRASAVGDYEAWKP